MMKILEDDANERAYHRAMRLKRITISTKGSN